MKMVVGISDWPESFGKEFEILPVLEGESDEDAIYRAQSLYDDFSLECKII